MMFNCIEGPVPLKNHKSMIIKHSKISNLAGREKDKQPYVETYHEYNPLIYLYLSKGEKEMATYEILGIY